MYGTFELQLPRSQIKPRKKTLKIPTFLHVIYSFIYIYYVEFHTAIRAFIESVKD
jgi:hypothetical protein